MIEVSKSDWKKFREIVPEWQERYMAKLNKEYIKILSQDKNASDNFWELANSIKKDQKSPGVIIEYHKQDVFFDVIRLFKDGVITDEDLADFSDDFRDTIKELKKRFI